MQGRRIDELARKHILPVVRLDPDERNGARIEVIDGRQVKLLREPAGAGVHVRPRLKMAVHPQRFRTADAQRISGQRDIGRSLVRQAVGDIKRIDQVLRLGLAHVPGYFVEEHPQITAHPRIHVLAGTERVTPGPLHAIGQVGDVDRAVGRIISRFLKAGIGSGPAVQGENIRAGLFIENDILIVIHLVLLELHFLDRRVVRGQRHLHRVVFQHRQFLGNRSRRCRRHHWSRSGHSLGRRGNRGG